MLTLTRIVLLLCLVTPGVALARSRVDVRGDGARIERLRSDLVGEWTSSTGNGVLITGDEAPFAVILTTPRGAQSLYLGRWTPGLEGTQFKYVVNGVARVATINARERDRIVVSGGGADVTWSRVGGLGGLERRGTVSGQWSSSSGNRFMVLSARRGAASFEVIATRTDGSWMLYRGRWVPGLEGTQFTYEADYTTMTATINAQTMETIRVVGGSAPTTWTRVDRGYRRGDTVGLR